jgi:tRNA G18 (ribose-2'-O)-methylase SpoU
MIMTHIRGYFGIGVEGISKEYNLGNLVRSAHAFGAHFFFTIAPAIDTEKLRASDTANSFNHMPYFQYDTRHDLKLPAQCALVAIELTDDAIALPSFRHPERAAYILGPEMGSVSSETLALCDHTIKIPMKFCVNVGVAGALVMYDRLISTGRHLPRPVHAGGPNPALDETFVHRHGGHRRKVRKK